MRIKDTKTVVVCWSDSMLHCHRIVDRAWMQELGEDVVVTGAQEVGHSSRSQHYGTKTGGWKAEAADYDSAGLNLDNYTGLVMVLRLLLGNAFQVLPAFLDGSRIVYHRSDRVTGISHVHIEFDPEWKS